MWRGLQPAVAVVAVTFFILSDTLEMTSMLMFLLFMLLLLLLLLLLSVLFVLQVLLLSPLVV